MKFEKLSFRTGLFFSFMLILFPALLLLSYVLYERDVTAKETQILDTYSQQLEYTSLVLDLRISELSSLSATYRDNTAFKKMVMEGTESSFLSFKQELKKLHSYNVFADLVCYYDESHNTVVSTRGRGNIGSFLSNEVGYIHLTETDLNTLLETMSNTDDERLVFLPDSGEFFFISPFTDIARHKQDVLINLNKMSIYQILPMHLIADDGFAFSIFRNNEPMLSLNNGVDILWDDIKPAAQKTDGTDRIITKKYNGAEFFLVSIQMPQTGWTIMMMMPKEYFASRINQSIITLVGVIALLFVVFVCLSVLLTNIHNRSIKRFLDLIPEHEMTGKNELINIYNALTNSMTMRKYLEEKNRHLHIQVIRNVYRSLLDGECQDEDIVATLFSDAEIPFMEAYVAVCVYAGGKSENDKLYYDFGTWDAYCIDCENDCLRYVLEFKQIPSEEQLKTIAEEFKIALALNENTVIGVGGLVTKPYLLNRSSVEAVAACGIKDTGPSAQDIESVTDETHTTHSSEADNEKSRVLQFIDENITNPSFGLIDIADHFGGSIYKWSHYIKVTTGVNYKDMITAKRILLAKRMLRETQLAIKDIAFQVGYNDTTSFIRSFKSIENVSPSQYRRLFQ